MPRHPAGHSSVLSSYAAGGAEGRRWLRASVRFRPRRAANPNGLVPIRQNEACSQMQASFPYLLVIYAI